MNKTWDDIQHACLSIAGQSKAYEPDCIVAVSRGGIVPARLVAAYLDIKYIYSLGLYSYAEDNTQSNIQEYQAPYEDLSRSSHKLAIVIDDIADTGNTFKHISKTWIKQCKNVSCIFAALYVRADCEMVPSIFYKKIPNKDWIVFPWETVIKV